MWRENAGQFSGLGLRLKDSGSSAMNRDCTYIYPKVSMPGLGLDGKDAWFTSGPGDCQVATE